MYGESIEDTNYQLENYVELIDRMMITLRALEMKQHKWMFTMVVRARNYWMINLYLILTDSLFLLVGPYLKYVTTGRSISKIGYNKAYPKFNSKMERSI